MTHPDPDTAVLDACVLFPTVLREMLLGAAGIGAFRPVWSARILEEWARATRRLPLGAEAIARAEIALMRETWPGAEVSVPDGLVESLSLPDEDDRHVLATAITAGAGSLVTRNRADFPPRLLAPYNVLLRDPDGFLLGYLRGGTDLNRVAGEVQARAEAASGRPQQIRALLKRAGLPRLGKALEAGLDA